MLSTTLKFLLRDLNAVGQRMEQWLSSLGAERRCAMRLDAMADRLASMGQKIDLLRQRIRAGDGDEPVDDDATLREALKSLKEDIRDIRCQLTAMDAPQLSGRIERAIRRLSLIAEETYTSADKLQWEIAEHDARYCEVG